MRPTAGPPVAAARTTSRSVRSARRRKPRGCGRAGRLARDAQLRVDVREMPLDGPDTQVQRPGDLLIAAALRDQCEDVALAVAQLADMAAHRLCRRHGARDLLFTSGVRHPPCG